MAERVCVTGMGIWTPLGRTPAELWSRLCAGESAIRRHADLEDFPVPFAARIEGDPDGATLAAFAAAAALEDAGLLGAGLAGAGLVGGVRVGTTLGESPVFEASAPGVPRPEDAAGERFLAAARTALAGTAAGFDGTVYATACVAGSHAIGEAAAAIAEGEADVLLAGGVEPFSRIAQVGFGRLRAMAPERCRPFAAAPVGMSLGAGAAFLVLESERSARARGARIHAFVAGFALSCDADHPTRPRADGAGMTAALRGATRAGVEIGWICGHGSGTPGSDDAELAAVERYSGRATPLGGLKGALGHAMGAATAIQAVVAVLALRHGVIPPTTGTLAPRGPVCASAIAAPGLRAVLSFGAAFGGMNAALVLARDPPPVTRAVDAPVRASEVRACAFSELAEGLGAMRGGTPPERVGVYVTVRDAGMAEAARLWTEALTHGPRFANPRLFPETLPSYLATTLARRLDARGPCVTVQAGAAVLDARRHVRRGQVDRALIVCLEDGQARLQCLSNEVA